MNLGKELLSPGLTSRNFCRSPSRHKEAPFRPYSDPNEKSLVEELEKIIIESD